MEQTKRQRQKEETKEKIIAAAGILYTTEGFLTPTQKIAQAAGVSHGTIFSHFPNKDKLITELLEQYFSQLGIKLREHAKTNAGLQQVLNTHLQLLEEKEEFYRRYIMDLPLLPAESQYAFIAFQTIVSNHFCTVAAQEKEKGALKDIAPHMLFNTWMALIHYYLQNRCLFAPEGAVIKRYKEELISSYLKMVQL